MLYKFFLFLAVAAVGLAVWYTAFYESATPNAQYPITYAWLSMLSAIIFAGLWYAGIINRKKNDTTILFD